MVPTEPAVGEQGGSVTNGARAVGAGTLVDPATYRQLNVETRLLLALTPFSGQAYVQVGGGLLC